MSRPWRVVAPLLAVPLTAFLLSGCAITTPPDVAAALVPANPPPPVDPASVQANELGAVPVLMYHRLVDEPVSVYDRTRSDFRAELERLAMEDYVPVTTAEYATGRIDVPAGKHPVVLTFDDGDPSTISLGPDGEPEAGTAMAILTEVAAAHPGFRPVASVYVNAEPFGGGVSGDRALQWLAGHGFEIGNHTAGHTDLRTTAPEKARRDVVKGEQLITEAVPDHAPSTLSLPFGSRPKDTSVVPMGEAGNGRAGRYVGVLLVGANPAPSPFSADFDGAAIPRIRSQGATGKEAEYGSTSWLDQLAADPADRYTSDGDPTRIAYPREAADDAATVVADGVTTLAY